jgi:hypothetical protein
MGFFVYVGLSSANATRSQILARCLHPAAAFTYGTLAFTEYEGQNIGVTANTWNVSNSNPITFQDTLTMMLVDAIWLGVLAWYCAHVMPSEFGTHEPPYFLFLPSFWSRTFGCSSTITRSTVSSRAVGEAQAPAQDKGKGKGKVTRRLLSRARVVKILHCVRTM